VPSPPVEGQNNLIVLAKTQNQSINELELSECVVIENKIRLLRLTLEEKRASLRQRLEDGAEVEECPLKSFARRIARMKGRKRRHVPFRRFVVR